MVTIVYRRVSCDEDVDGVEDVMNLLKKETRFELGGARREEVKS